MQLGLKGKTVVITGGSAGIGRQTAIEFAKEGCNIAICSRTQEKLDLVAAQILELGVLVYTETVDAADIMQTKLFAEHVCEKFGRIDVWVNNVGGNRPKPIWDCTEEDFDYTITMNLKTTYFASNVAAEHMKKDGKGGVILHVSSYGTVVPGNARSLYAISKGAINILTRCQAAEYAPFGIRTAAVLPGTTRTDMTAKMIAERGEGMIKTVAQRRFGEPEEIARPLVFLASDASSFITGTCLEISGGKLAVQNPDACWK